MKKKFLFCIILSIFLLTINLYVSAESVFFRDDKYELKHNYTNPETGITENEYFTQKQNKTFWTSMIKTEYYPNIKNTIKFAENFDKEIETKNNMLLLKFIRNKKLDISIISYLENITENNENYFIYNISKYEKHPEKGMMVLTFSKKYPATSKETIMQIGKEIKKNNDDYIERMIILQIPPTVK